MTNAHPPEQKTILVVEDDDHIAKLIEFCLAREGFLVRRAADGEQALKEFDRAQADALVIMDVMMPYRNGYELLADLRDRPAWRQVPVIMLTSRGKEEDVVQGLNLGASDYLTKPFRPAELVARAMKLLRSAPEAGQ
ncbi:MAG: response regulator [Burkholderiales bacterium]|nr:response regulator [Burkholderiales bacterium]